MSLQTLRTKDWEHRIGILEAWRYVLLKLPLQDPNRAALYGATLDGCAITVRALCYGFDVHYNFLDFEAKLAITPNDRVAALEQCLARRRDGTRFKPVGTLTSDSEEQRCLLEVLFLANRAVAHPTDGKHLDHEVSGGIEMPTAINVILANLKSGRHAVPMLDPILKTRKELFEPLPIAKKPSAQPGQANP